MPVSTAATPSATAVTMRDADPRAAGAAQPERLDAEVEQVLLVGGHEDRCAGVGQREVGVVRQRGRLGRGIVAHEQHGAAARPRPHEVGVLEHVAGPVEAGALAVPGADDAVDALVGDGPTHLRAPHRRRRQLLVEPGPVDDPGGAEPVAQPLSARSNPPRGEPG